MCSQCFKVADFRVSCTTFGLYTYCWHVMRCCHLNININGNFISTFYVHENLQVKVTAFIIHDWWEMLSRLIEFPIYLVSVLQSISLLYKSTVKKVITFIRYLRTTFMTLKLIALHAYITRLLILIQYDYLYSGGMNKICFEQSTDISWLYENKNYWSKNVVS